MKRLVAALIFAAAFGAAPALAQKREPDPVVEFSERDAEMNAAVAEARRTYGQFLADFAAAPAHFQDGYMVKVGLPTPDGRVEHIWVNYLRRDGERLVGVLANEPVALPGMHLGAPLVVDHELVSDWAIIAPEGMYGSFTTRVMLPYIAPAEAEQLRQILTPSPLPMHWSS